MRVKLTMRNVEVGVLAGVFAGILFGLLMEFLPAPGAGAGRISMALYAAQALHAQSRLVGWFAYLVYGGVIGGLFGYLLRGRRLDEASAIVWGGIYGLGWWILAGLVLVPALRGAVPLSPSAVGVIRPIALTLLAGHMLYGLVLGAAFPLVDRRVARGAA
jgi:hypothetical protein